MNIRKSKTKESGSALMLSLFMLGVILTITFSVLNVVLPRFKIERQSTNSVGAFFAADSIIEWCFYASRVGPIPQPVMTNESTYIITRLSDGLADCPLGQPLNHRATGTYHGVSRSSQIN